MSDFVVTGRMSIEKPGGGTHEIVVGIRRNTGKVSAYVNGATIGNANSRIPDMWPTEAQKFAELFNKAASVAGPIVEAQRKYQAVVDEALSRVNA